MYSNLITFCPCKDTIIFQCKQEKCHFLDEYFPAEGIILSCRASKSCLVREKRKESHRGNLFIGKGCLFHENVVSLNKICCTQQKK